MVRRKQGECIALNKGGVMLQKKAVIVFLLFVFCGYSAGCGKKPKTKDEHYPDGKLKAVYTYNDEGLLDGVVKKYNEDGSIKSEETYKNNLLNGISKEYRSGKLHADCYFKDNKKNGIMRLYYENGNVHFEFNYKDDKNEGIGKKYYWSGKLDSEGNYKDGKQEGVTKYYYENGKLDKEINYKDGRELSRTCYDENGNKTTCK